MILPTLPWWAWAAVVWWVGMIPAAYIAGQMQKSRRLAEGKPFSDGIVVIFVTFWPLWLIMLPIAGAHMRAQRPAPDGEKPAPAKRPKDTPPRQPRGR